MSESSHTKSQRGVSCAIYSRECLGGFPPCEPGSALGQCCHPHTPRQLLLSDPGEEHSSAVQFPASYQGQQEQNSARSLFGKPIRADGNCSWAPLPQPGSWRNYPEDCSLPAHSALLFFSWQKGPPAFHHLLQVLKGNSSMKQQHSTRKVNASYNSAAEIKLSIGISSPQVPRQSFFCGIVTSHLKHSKEKESSFPFSHISSVQGCCCHCQHVQVLLSDIWALVHSPRII